MTPNQPTTKKPTDPRTAADKLMYLPDLDPQIEEARIAFALERRLKNRVALPVPTPQTAPGEEYGRVEGFRDESGRLVVLLRNICRPPPSVLNMKRAGRLYQEDVQTYVGTYAGLTEFRARLEAVENRGPKFGAARHLFTEPPTPRRERGRQPTRAKA